MVVRCRQRNLARALPVLLSCLVVLALARAGGPSPAGAAAGRPQGTPRATEPPTATPDASPPLCVLTARQSAATETVERGRPLELRLVVSATCPDEARGRADILLVVDHSSSMEDRGKYEAAAEAVRQFVGGVDFARHRVGLVLFNDRPWVAQPLTDRPDRLLRAFEDGGPPVGGTDAAAAIRTADSELELRGRRDAVGIIVLLSDGQSNVGGMLAAAQQARRRGTVIFVIGLGHDVEEGALREVASTPEHYYHAPGAEGLAEIYVRIAATIRAFSVTNVLLSDRPAAAVRYVRDSSRPDPPLLEDPLTWRVPFVVVQETGIAYQVRIDRLGRVQPSAAVWADYTDGDGVRRRVVVPPVAVEVVEPTIRTLHLPLAWRNACHPVVERADIVLALDVSSSMSGAKLQQAVTAARAFLALVDLGPNRVAAVAYDSQARLLQPLTADRGALERSLAGLVTGYGTRLDRGIAAAVAALTGPDRRHDSRAAILLLSDGQQVEAVDQAYDWADAARAWGIDLYTIAFGEDADRGLLHALADSPGHAFYAASPEALRQIYAQLAGAVRCR